MFTGFFHFIKWYLMAFNMPSQVSNEVSTFIFKIYSPQPLKLIVFTEPPNG